MEIIGKVVKSYAKDWYLTDGKLGWRKIHPLIWGTGDDFNYFRLEEQSTQEQIEQK